MSSPSPLVTTIVQAGAGTGKTESLARRILAVALSLYGETSGARHVPRLVATTFTERATAELRERVSLLLAAQSDPPLWLRDFVQDQDRLQISTIHGTLSSLLHRFGSLVGIDPEFTIIDNTEEKRILGRVIREVISKNSEFGFLLEQYTFKELVGFIAALVSHYRLHGRDFTVALGWKDLIKIEGAGLVESFRELGTLDISAIPVKTGAIIRGLMRLGETFSNYGDDFKTLREEFLNSVEGIKKPTIRSEWPGAEKLKQVINQVFAFRDHFERDYYDVDVNTRHDEMADRLFNLTIKVSELHGIEKRDLGALTFNDLEFLTVELMEKYPGTVMSIREDFDFWFVDEYQDTSPLQKKILFEFFREPHNVYFVGDPQQSIYLFRGAIDHVFQDTKKQVEKMGGSVERLEVNYRSHPDLLNFLNFLFASMKKPIGRLEAKGSCHGEVRAIIHLVESDEKNSFAEEDLVAYQCLEWKKQGHDFHEMAVLVRTNDKGRQVARALSESGIPVFVHSSGGFYDRREIIDALGLLSFLEDPSDDYLFVLIARSPWLRIDDVTLANWAKIREKKTYWEWLILRPDYFKEIETLSFLKNAVDRAEFWPLSVVFEDLMEKLGLLEFSLVGDASGRREANLRKLLWKLKEDEKRPGFNASLFIERAWQEMDSVGEESEAASFIEPQRVNILTVHKSKGLKFNCVVIPHCGDAPRPKSNHLELAPDGRWAIQIPAGDSEEKVSPLLLHVLKEQRWEREFEEEARVFYVAVTRSAEKLALVAKAKINEKSWLGQTSLPLGVGNHAAGSYEVHIWDKRPQQEKFIPDESRFIDQGSTLPYLKENKSQRFTVTEVVRLLNPKEFLKAPSELPFPGQRFRRQLEAQQRGQAVHFIFEELKNDVDQDIGNLCDIARMRFSAGWKIDSTMITKTMNIQDPPLRILLQNGFVEWPFEFRQTGSYYEGQIDLWADLNDETWIIDYKSTKDITDEALRRATQQLEIYALGVHKFGRDWKRLRMAVIVPLEGKAHEVPLRDKDAIIEDLNSLGRFH